MKTYDEHQTYSSEDDTDVQDFANFQPFGWFTRLHPIFKGLIYSALTGVGLFLLIAVIVYGLLENWF